MDYKKGLKGVNKYRNTQIDHDAFKRCYENGDLIMGQNCGFHPVRVNDSRSKPNENNLQKEFVVVKSEVNKIALSNVRTKMIVMKDGICAPFIYELTAKDYG
ncbi:hypothetical protein FACS189472_16470 [Alphaproteobacteria bacterium]|nr:hypothetical protein FACS189472_16470 [Alphaproteobacteria bacterium]